MKTRKKFNLIKKIMFPIIFLSHIIVAYILFGKGFASDIITPVLLTTFLILLIMLEKVLPFSMLWQKN